ncbi:SpoIIE family protein phosphatase [Micromonospora sp. NPDC048930]|uniref:SpoIIE family protein phosphatase n=1 Tax=Micromonospora sp. NPDC048930 TaxID=3364261 RepID=UPI00371A508C
MDKIDNAALDAALVRFGVSPTRPDAERRFRVDHTPPDGSRWQDVLATGGEMGVAITAHDWSATPLGPIGCWPQGLRTAVVICLHSRFPILLLWGDELVMLYNDAFRPILGSAERAALGRPAVAVWPEIWDVIGPMLAGVLAGAGATWDEDQRLLLDRNGFTEECYFTFSLSPIIDESGEAGGVFTAITETTGRVVSERRLRLLTTLATALVDVTEPEEVLSRTVKALTGSPSVPFVRLYLAGPDGPRLVAGDEAEPAPGAEARWPLAEVLVDGKLRLLPVDPADDPDRPGVPTVAVVPVPAPGGTAPMAVLVAGLNPRRPVDADYLSFVSLLAGHVGTALAGALAYRAQHRRAETVARDVSDRQRALRQAEALARLAGALSSAQGRPAILDVVTTVAPAVVDAAALRVAIVHPGTTLLEVADRDAPAGPLPVDADQPLARAVRENAVLPLTGDGAETTGLCLPLRYGDGGALGALEVRWTRPVADDEALRNLLDAVAGLCSQALQRAELTGSAQAMADFAARLSVARSTAEAIDVILDAAPTALGAVLPGLAMRDEGRLVRLWYHEVPETLSATFHDLTIDDPRPIVHALRTGERILLRDRADFAARFPGLPDPVGAHGLVTTVALPLFDAQRQPIAGLGFGWWRERPLRESDLALLDTIADLCEQTLERVRLAAAEHNLVTRLAGRLRSSALTTPDGLEIATRYQPAMTGLHLGGDWYDLVRQDDDRLAVVVGDVVGHQVEAAADMAQLRTVLNTLIRLGVPLPELFLRLTELLGVGFLGTCLVVVVDPAGRAAHLVRAGHPHPVLLRAGQDPQAVHTTNALPMGMVDAPMTVTTVPFEPGDLLVAYTDGLVERRGQPYDDGVAALHRALVAVRDEPAEAIADALLRDLPGTDDDRALVVLRHTG